MTLSVCIEELGDNSFECWVEIVWSCVRQLLSAELIDLWLQRESY